MESEDFPGVLIHVRMRMPRGRRTGCWRSRPMLATGQTRFWLVVAGVCATGLLVLEALRRML
jgi:hypothetical protein